VDFTITVPAKTALELHGMSSDIEVSNVCGELDVNTMNGDISVDCAEGNVQMQTISGDITMRNVRGPVDISTTSGSIDLNGVRGQIAAQSVSGDISLAQIESSDITAEVVSGDVSYEGRLVDGGRYKFAAHSGDVTLTVPGTPNAAISIETFNGEFESDFQITMGGNGNRVGGKNMEFRLGTGSARVQLSSFSGTISLRRQGASNREE
jgi:DUF4097 and DUF4098 domain-containing protein YvlB